MTQESVTQEFMTRLLWLAWIHSCLLKTPPFPIKTAPVLWIREIGTAWVARLGLPVIEQPHLYNGPPRRARLER